MSYVNYKPCNQDSVLNFPYLNCKFRKKQNKTKKKQQHIVVFESGVMFLMLDNDILIQVQADVCNGIHILNDPNF